MLGMYQKMGSGENETSPSTCQGVFECKACGYCICRDSRCVCVCVCVWMTTGHWRISIFLVVKNPHDFSRFIPNSKNHKSIARGASRLKRRGAQLLHRRTSLTQVDTGRWQPLSNLPSSANLKSPPDHMVLISFNCCRSLSAWSSLLTPIHVFTLSRIPPSFPLSHRSKPHRGTIPTLPNNNNNPLHPGRGNDSHQQYCSYRLNETWHSNKTTNNNLNKSREQKK